MKGETALHIALVTHANDYLYGSMENNYGVGNSTRKYIREMTFADRDGALLANSPEEWFTLLRNRGVDCLKLWWRTGGEHDRETDILVGGGAEWFIEVKGQIDSDIYLTAWKHRPIASTERNGEAEERPWIVEYRMSQVINLEPQGETIDPVAMKIIMQRILEEALHFSEAQSITTFSGHFMTGLECLESLDPMNNKYAYHKDLAPRDFVSLEALQILACCQASYVFGGMGSWNDLSFTGEAYKRYKNLSDRLYVAINRAIVCAVNSG